MLLTASNKETRNVPRKHHVQRPAPPKGQPAPVAEPANRKMAIICSKGGLDEVYPALILANGARQAGIDAMIFFTFWGLDAINDKKVDHLGVKMTGNPSSPLPTIITRPAGNGVDGRDDDGQKSSSRSIFRMLARCSRCWMKWAASSTRASSP